ncbi:hypothetical protein GW916_15655, partial [bacterium]|nr:hypothetical protein [bacterium]
RELEGAYNKDQHSEEIKELKPKVEELLAKDKEFASKIKELGHNYQAVPSAPLKKTWHEFVMKRVIRMAAEEGYDTVAWTTGEQQAERYDLSTQVDSINYAKRKDGLFDLDIIKDGGTVLFKAGINEKGVVEFVGKEVGAKIISGKGKTEINTLVNGRHATELSGLDLKVGGHGMKGFYDQMLPSFVNKFTKKWGGKTEDIDLTETGNSVRVEARTDSGRSGFFETEKEAESWLDKENDGGQIMKPKAAPSLPVHSLALTPALKEAALYEGFTLFQPAYHGTPHNFDKFTLDHIGKGEGAQAYGWGLYFAGNKEVAKYYRESLTEVPYKYTLYGKDIEKWYEKAGTNDTEWAEVLERILGNHEHVSELKEFFTKENGYSDKLIKRVNKLKDSDIKAFDENGKEISKGYMYEVDIPEDDVLLDWDKLLSEQSEYVKKAIAPLLTKEGAIKTEPGYYDLAEGTGKNLYSVLSRLLLPSDVRFDYEYNSTKEASQYLNNLGIKGIKYKTGQISGTKGGGYNYVIFDDKSIDILNKFYQKKEGVVRGFYSQTKNVIGLLKNRNESTLPHELSHAWLTDIWSLVKSGKADTK